MSEPIQKEGLWKVADVARYLSMSDSWVYKETEAGRLPCIRVGASLRFFPDEIRKFIDSLRSKRGSVVALGGKSVHVDRH